LHNSLWLAANAPSALSYKRALKSPRQTQQRILSEFLKKNTNTLYGQQHNYAKINNVAEFQECVPIVTYDDLEPWIERIKNGEEKVLTNEPVRFFETTSGSTSGKKFIPYTDSLINQFKRSVSAWLFDLMMSHPKILLGSQYWSISPVGEKPRPVECGIPVGIDSDAAYLGLMAKIALQGVLAVPLKVASISDVEEWRNETIRHLTRRKDLRFVSVWNPSFFSLLIDRIPATLDVATCWPSLQLISCWTSGSAHQSLTALQEALPPGIKIQGKGLLATEGVVSIPFGGRLAPTLAVNSHFLEFIDNAGLAHLVDDLVVGKRYRVVITTGGGFARYDLGDEVEVIEPLCVEFVGRNSVSDMCGEKLSEAFVSNIFARKELNNCFSMLVPESSNTKRYLLLTDSARYKEHASLVENTLLSSFHYSYCRKLGQLGPVEAVYVRDAEAKYMKSCIDSGQRAGDIKPTALRTDFGWREKMLDHDKI